MNGESQPLFQDTEVAFAYKSNAELQNGNFVFSTAKNPATVGLGKGLARAALALHLPVKGLIRKTVFRQFCGGEDIKECQETARRLNKFGVKAILDYSVEGEKSEKGFDKTALEILKTIEIAPVDPVSPFTVFKVTGIASTVLLEKLQEGKSLTEDEQETMDRALLRFDTLCKAAFNTGVPILVDAEESWMQRPIDEIVYDLMSKYNRERPIVYNTYQMYKKESLGNLKSAIEHAREQGYHLGAKLVRGAYMEKERERAAELGYPDPIQPDKESTDRDYNEGIRVCIENIDVVGLFNGTHNEYSNVYCTELMKEAGLENKDERVWFSQLYGMSDHISFNLAKLGYNVVKYVPYGPVRSVMPYLFRRAEENTSIEGQTNKELYLIRRELKRRRSVK